MNTPTTPDPNNPTPTPGNPNPEPARPPPPPETPPPEPPSVPPLAPDPIPAPEDEPIQIPPGSPNEVPSERNYSGPSLLEEEANVVKTDVCRKLKLTVAMLVCIMGTATSATAQPGGEQEVVPADPCQVQPEARSEDLTPDPPKEDLRSQNALEHCKGVLTPPRTGDEEIEEPPPNTGTTRIIRPGDVPEQPPN